MPPKACFLVFAALWIVPCLPQTLQPEQRQALELEIQTLREKLRLQQAQLDSLEKRLRESTAPAALPPPPPAAEAGEALPEPEAPPPMDLSGYYSFRYFNDTRPAQPGAFQAHVASLFFGKKMGRWRFFSEVEFEYAPAFEGNGLSLSPQRGEVVLETVWLNYGRHDWLNARAGLLLVPTYWRIHHYPSTTLTVQNPLIDQAIFPGDIVGAMVHGSRYFADGGLDYTWYAGNGRGPNPGRTDADDHKATGGNFVVHVPTRHFFQTFDLGVQWYSDKLSGEEREGIYGFESKIEKGPLGFLGEFAHANIGAAHRSRKLFREGYYLQPWWRVGRRTHLVYRYDLLNFDSRTVHSTDFHRHTVGVNFRPVPTVSLKLEFNRYRPEGGPGGYRGVAAGLAFFFQ